MSILRANLKHLYQKRSFWFIGLFFGTFAFLIIMVLIEAVTENKQGRFFAPAILMFFVGTFIATLPIDVLTKPFSYCLPGHRKIPREFLSFVGLPLSFLWSLSFLFYPDLNIVKTILACLSVFSIFTTFYWLGVWFVFRFRNWGVVFALLPLLALGNMWLNMSVFVDHTIVENSLPMILLGGLVNYLAWRYWGRPNLARRYCGMLWIGAFDAWNKEKMSKYKLARLAEKNKKKPDLMRISSGVEGFFVSRISRAQTGSVRQYIWGGLYRTFGVQLSQRRQDLMWIFVIFLPTLCVFGYMAPLGNIIFFIPGIMVGFINLNVRSSLLISGGRRERFWSGLTLAATVAILITFLVTFIAVLTMPLELILPELTIKGYTAVFNALSIKLFFVPLLVIPITFAIGLVFHKKPMLTMIFEILLFQILLILSVFQTLENRPGQIGSVPGQIGSVHVIIIFLCSWAIFVAVLRYICMKRSLVGQGK